MIEEIFVRSRSTIVLNGSFAEDVFLPFIRKSACLIAADGAAEKFARWNITPSFIVGDRDSFFLPFWKELYHMIEDQDHTDFEKALHFAREKQKMPPVLLGINGGEIDHFLGNIYVLMQARQQGQVFFLDAQKQGNKIVQKLGVPLKDEIFQGKAPVGSTVSIFPYPSAVCSSQGLFWELNNARLSIEKKLSLRNRIKSASWQVTVRGQCLLICDL